MRLQTFLSCAGVSSRRSAVDIIKSGIVKVNNKKVVVPSFDVDSKKDIILLNNKMILEKEKIYIMLNKPAGVTTTKGDPFAVKIVMSLLPAKFRHLNPVGRLDKDTTGLLLLTNNGTIINKFTHPKFNVEKVYAVGLNRRLEKVHKEGLEKGINLDGKCTAPCAIKLKGAKELEIVIHEGKKRQIRRMFSKMGYRVMTLKRLKEDFLELGSLPEGKWRFLTGMELEKLEGAYGIE